MACPYLSFLGLFVSELPGKEVLPFQVFGALYSHHQMN